MSKKQTTESTVMRAELEIPVVETFTPHCPAPGLFRAVSLRDRIRQARLLGVSLDIVPIPSAFDEDGEYYTIDPDADIRCSRLDRADILVETASRLDAQKTASGSQPGSPTEVAAQAPISAQASASTPSPGGAAPDTVAGS